MRRNAGNALLTSFQREMWLANQALPEAHPGLLSGGQFVIAVNLDPDLLRQALRQTVDHYPLLAATLRQTGEALPVLEFGNFPEPDLRVLDLKGADDPEVSARRFLEHFREEPFAPLGGRLCRFALLQLAADRCWVLCNVFHLVGDGVFVISLFNVLLEAYSALRNGETLDLGPPCQWEEEVEADRQHRASPRFAKDIEFWSDYLRQLPTERTFKPRYGCPDRIETIGMFYHAFSVATIKRLRGLAEALGGASSVFAALHAVVLGRLHDADTLSIQTPFRLGERRDSRKIYGNCVCVMPAVVELAPTETFRTLLSKLQAQAGTLLRHVRTPFQEGLRKLEGWRSYEHLWDTNINYLPLTVGAGDIPVPFFGTFLSKYEPVLLGVYVVGNLSGDRVILSIPYSHNHFTEADVRRYVERLEQLIAAVCLNPDVPLARIDLLLEAERQALARWQQGQSRKYVTGTIPQCFDQVAEAFPDRLAVRGVDGTERTYQDVRTRSDGIAAWLNACGGRPGEVVAVLARRHPALVETLLGIMKAGMIYLPVDPDYPAERIRHMQEDSAARLVLALDETDAGLRIPATLPESVFPTFTDASAPAYLIYTSGSTGRPKGVLVPHLGFMNMIQGQIEAFNLSLEDRVLQFASPSFDASLSEIFMALLAGASLYPVPRALLDEPWKLRDYMSVQGITVVTLPPSYLSLFQQESFLGLRTLITAGEAPVIADARHYAAQLAYFNAYGPTEASVCATLTRVNADSQIISIGKPMPNTRVYILDSRGRQVAPGMAGELCVGGPGLALGYLNRPEMTAEKFVFSPLLGERIYRTGDRAAWTETGEIVLLGRLDEQVKLRGHRVELGEVSSALERHPSVAQACALALPGGGGGLDLWAFILPTVGGSLDVAAVRAWLQGCLPDYMVPSHVVLLNSMPLAPTGKVDKGALTRLAEQAELPMPGTRTGSVLEEVVRSHYETVLGHPVADLNADFFALGGDSLKAMDLVRRLSEAFACEIPVRRFLADTRIVAVAQNLVGMTEDVVQGASAEPEFLPLNQGQRQLWVQECMSGSGSCYNMPYALEIEASEADTQRFVTALLQAIKTQPSCCCRVVGEIDSPRLDLDRSLQIEIERLDLCGESDIRCRELFAARVQQPFELDRAPLLRLALFRRAPTRWQLLLVMHHLIGDGESLRILLRDACRAYGGTSLVAVPADLLQEFAEAEASYLLSPDYKVDLAYWMQHLTPLPARLDLIPTRRRPAIKGIEGGIVRHALSPAHVAGLLRLAGQAETSVLGVFVGLLMRFVRVRTQSSDVALAVPVGQRDTAALADVAGFFVNPVIVRENEGVEVDLLTSLRSIGIRLRQAVVHGRVPFGRLPNVVGQQRDPSRSPLVDLMATHIDDAALLPKDLPDGLGLRPLPVDRTAAQLDFTFILHSGHDGIWELLLEHDIHVASTPEATDLLAAFADFIAESVTAVVSSSDQPTAASDRALACSQEDALAQAWQEILGSRPEAASNFFLCGGDSIKAIQMVGLLRRRGVSNLTPTAFFEHPLFSALCEQLSRAGDADLRQSSVLQTARPGEGIPLLPVQRALIDNHPEHWRGFHMALPLRLSSQIDVARLWQALDALPMRHEALRLAFSTSGAQMLSAPCTPPRTELKLSATVTTQEAFTRAGEWLFPRLDPERGRCFGAVLIQHGEERLLLLAGHHLVLDAVSLDVLRRELAWFCRSGIWPPRTEEAGAASWAQQLDQHASRIVPADEGAAWATLCGQPTAPLAALRAAGSDRVAERCLCARTLPNASHLLSSQPRADLLATLTMALWTAGEREPLFVTLEGHGREAVIPNIDASEAVGWYTTCFPVRLVPSRNSEQTLSALTTWFARLVHGGLGYGLAVGQGMVPTYQPQIVLNYLGRMLASEEDEGFTVLPEFAQPGALPGLLPSDFCPDAPLDLLVSTSEADELKLVAWHSPDRLDQDWVERLLAAWADALEILPRLRGDVSATVQAELIAATLCRAEEIEAMGRPDPAQEGMLFQHLFDGGQGQTYVQQINFRLDGEIDEAILARAWALVVARHESLRTLFPATSAGEFYRLVLKRGRNTFEFLDLSALPATLQDERREAVLRTRRETSFDLARGPLFQGQLLRFGPSHYEMSWCLHHLLMDGWCTGILLRELFTSYAALRQGKAPALPPAPALRPYRDWLHTRDQGAARTFWRDLLAGFSTPSLIAPVGVGSEEEGAREERELRLSVETTRGLQRTAARLAVSLPHLVQALWGLMLGVLSGQRDAVYGIVSAGRPAEVEGIEQMVGLFIQTLPVRMNWQEDDAFSALVLRLRTQAVTRAAHEHLPLAEIQRLAGVSGPLFDSLVVVENYPLDGIVQEGAPNIVGVSGFEQHPYAFGLAVVPGERLLFRFTGHPACFREGQVEARWLALVEALAEVREWRCGELEAMMTSVSAIPASFNASERIYPRESSVGDVFRAQAAAYPTTKALIAADGTSWDYQHLDRVSDAIAAGLGELVRGEVVALSLPRGPEAVAAMLGVLKAGGCYLPLDEKSPPQRLAEMLAAAACHHLIRGRDDVRLDGRTLAGLLCLDFENLISADPGGLVPFTPEATQAAYVMFTSGSTGEPKGVIVPHRAILRLVCNSDFWKIEPGERMLQAGPLGFDASTLEIWGPLLNGGTVCFISDDALLSPGGLKSRLRVGRVTQMWLTSSLCNLLADEEPSSFAPLRRLFTGGEALSPGHIAKILAACPDLEIFNGYGPTENTTFTTTYRVTATDLNGGPIPIGRPVANTRVHIIGDAGLPVAVGEWGEICAAGDGLALGYIGRDDLTRRAFLDLPSPVGERVYRTGDIGRWRSDGVIEFQGRRDGQVKLRGFRIELAEIESKLARLPGVRQAAVLVTGSGADKRLIAFVKADSPPAVLREGLQTVLPAYMMPDRIECLEDLPINANGKIDRGALEGVAKSARKTRVGGEQERGSVEGRIAAAFGEILGLDDVPDDVDFFELGGHSLKAMRLLGRLKQEICPGLSMRDVMATPCVVDLARRVRELGTAEREAIRLLPRGEQSDYPLASGQERLWFLQHLQPESTAYHVPFAARLPGGVDPQVLQQALLLIEARHDALRLRMADNLEDAAPRQRIAPVGDLRLEIHDFREVADPGETVAAAVEAALSRPFRFGFDAPLVRAWLFRESADSAVLVLNFHHLICDGWSSEIFLSELQEAYISVLSGRVPEWSPLPLRYVDYAIWQREYLAGPACENEKARWRERMMPLPEPINLPIDKPRPVMLSQQGGVLALNLDVPRLEGLKTLARGAGLTLFPVLLALVKTFLYRHTGQTDLVVGVPVANREDETLQGLVGFFVNTLPLRDRLNPGASFAHLVDEIGHTWRETLADQIYPLEMLVDDLKVPRDPSRNPLFDVIVSLEDSAWLGAAEQGALDFSPFPLPRRQSKLDLSFYFREAVDGLKAEIEFSTDLFERESIERMGQRLVRLIDAVLASPQSPLRDLPLMPDSEREQVLHGFNSTEVDWNLNETIDGQFGQALTTCPNAIALRTSDGEVMSYSAFDRHVAALAASLQAKGVLPGSFVGVCYERSLDMMLAIFAILRAGAVYVPFAPGLPRARVAAMAEDLGTCRVLVAPERAEDFRALGLSVLETEAVETPFVAPHLPKDAAAYVIFTSGSTGRPKGVLVEQRGVLNRIFWMQSRFPLGEHDVILQKTPISFDVSVWELFWWSWTGASLALLAPGDEKNPAAIVEAIERHGVTTMHFVPSMLRAFLDHLEHAPEAVTKLASLRRVFASGEALTAELVTRFNRLLYKAHGTELHNLYGPTEATVDVSWQPCSPMEEGVTVSIGRPIANTRLYVLDNVGQPVPIGVSGELFISGIQVARGYVGQPTLTAERFLPDPFVPLARMYRTGDLARWLPGGEIEYLGRCDDQVKIRGFRIELGEVEAALERCASVAQAVVRVGQVGGMPALEAFLVPTVGRELKLIDLRRELSQCLPDYMCPAVFFEIEQVPLSSSGKADRKALKGRRLSLHEVSATTGSALTEVEQAVMGIWTRLLPEAGMIDLDQNFFDLGGNSLLLIRLHEALDARWPGSFSLAELFVAVTVRQQVAHLEGVALAERSIVSTRPTSETAVAVIGMALRLADYEETEALWTDLLSGADRTGPLPEKRLVELGELLASTGEMLDPARVREAAYLNDISGFDCKRFGMSPADARLLDPEQRLFLETASRALEDAGYGGQALKSRDVGIFVGASPVPFFKEAVGRSFPEQVEQAFMLNVPSSMATRLGYLRDWSGPAELVDTACSSSLKAVWDACQSLARGECSLALAGGARVMIKPMSNDKSFAIETSSGKTRTFDAEADGVGGGEGALAFLLKPLAQAQADGDAIHAVILGGAVNQDGRSASIAAPSPVAQAQVIRTAAAVAGVDLDSLAFFEAHGTGTALGDPIEIDGLTRAFGQEPARKAWIGSVKGNFGHLDSAAGVVGLAKAILALEHGVVPRQPHFERPNPRIGFERAPVAVARENEVLPATDQPWRCGVSAFGLSGINVHLILEQAPSAMMPADNGDWFCVPISAASEDGLRSYAENILLAVATHPQWSLHSLAASLVLGREHLACRLAVVANTRQTFVERLTAWCLGEASCVAGTVRPIASTVEICGATGEGLAREQAAGFLAGAEPVWPEGRAAWRVHLPSTPMERVKCWPKFPAKPIATRSGWLGEGAKGPQGWLFGLPVHDEGFWPVAEHRLAGHPTLVGMALPGLLAEAIKRINPQARTLRIEGLNWLRPLVAERVSSVSLSLHEDGDGFSASLVAEDAGVWTDFATARIAILDAQLEQIDLAALRTRISQPVSMLVSEAVGAVEVSPRWNCRRDLWQSEDGREALAWLIVPEAYVGDLRDTAWHPALLDVAASLILDRPGLVPVCCRVLRLHRALPATLFAHVVRRDVGQSLEGDCVLVNEQGEVLVELRGLLFAPLQMGKPRLHKLIWKDAAQSAVSQTAGGEILVLGSGPLVGGLVACLERQGTVVRQRDWPDGVASCNTLAEEVVGGELERAIFVLPESGLDWSFAALMQVLCRRGLRKPLSLLVAGRGALPGDTCQALSPDAALALGLLLSLAQEEALLLARYAELDGEVSPEAVIAELDVLSPDETQPIRLCADGRRLQRELSSPLPSGVGALPTGAGCVVVTGGLGAMALSLAETLVPTLGDSLALLHRGDFPPESEWEVLCRGEDPLLAERATRLLALREKGIAFRLYACDVSNRDALATCLSVVRRDLGMIGGVLHTAGVAGDGFLLHKTEADFDAVLGPKVDAARHLHALTLDDPLRFFVLAGSRTALTGAPGQTDYTAANAWLAAFAVWRRAQNQPATVIDWNTWREIGMAVRHGVVIETAASLAPEQAADVFLQALASGEAEVVVTMPGESLSPRPSSAARPSPEIGGVFADPEQPFAERVLLIVGQGLGYETPLSQDDDFYALGGDSIGGMQIVNRLQRELGIPVSLADLFSNSRLGDLVEALARLDGKTASDRPKAAPERADYPVSREQLAVLRAEASAKPHTGYNLPQFLRLPEDFDFNRLNAALDALIARHEVLRTRFLDPAGEAPRMEILSVQPYPLEEKTLVTLDAQSIVKLVYPFDLRRAPLFRASVLRVSDEGSLLFFDIHHALADARGVNVILTDLYRLYRGETLPDPGLQQKDAAWDQQERSAEEEATAQAYWLERFAGPLPKLDLPADHARPRFHTNRAGTASFAVPDEWVGAVRALASEQGTTPYLLMLTLWSLLLARLAGVEDLVIAVATDGRDREEFETTAGMFAALLPLRLEVPETASFEALLASNRLRHTEAMRHRAFPLNRLLGALKAPISPERTLLSEVTFSYMNFSDSEQGGFVLRPVSNPSCKADLAIFASDTGDHLFFALEYYADLFDAARMDLLGQQFLDLLRELFVQGVQTPTAALRWSEDALPDCGTDVTEPLATGTKEEADVRMLAYVLDVFRRFFSDASVGVDDSFFDLGGHSLLGLQMANEFARESGRDLTIRDVLDHPTPREMARLLAEGRGEDRRIRRGEERSDGRYPLSHAQQRLYVLHHTDGGATAYNMSFVFRIEGLLDLPRLQSALYNLCKRHEVLRTAFVEEEGQVWQAVQEDVDPQFLSHRLDAGAFDEALELFRRDAVRTFVLDQAPLLRLRVCELGGERTFLSLVMHHIIGDGWSMQIFFGELLALYADKGVALPALPVQYRDYAVWQQGQDWKAEAEYWRQTLKGAPERIALPGDAVRADQPRPAGIVRRMLPPVLLEGLRRYARHKGVSLATLCLTLFSATLYRITRQQDMVIGMGVAGRERAELEGLIGFFVNILPIRVRVDSETEIEDLLDQVHRASLEALERQGYPFDLLVREVSASRGGQRESLVNVMFEYQRYSDLQQIMPEVEQHGWPECSVVDIDPVENSSDGVDSGVGPGAKYDLTLFLQDEPEGCRLKAEFNRDLLTEHAVSNWLAYLEAFMGGLVDVASREHHENH